MIKFLGTKGDRKYLGLVITKENVERLMLDMPIHFHAEQMNLPIINVNEIAIIYSETDKGFVEAIKRAGFNPIIKIDPTETKM